MNKRKAFFNRLRKRLFNKKTAPYFLILFIVVAGLIFMYFRRKVDEYVIENHSLYQMFAGSKIEYDNSTIKLDKEDNITTISFGEYKVDLDSNPLYYQDEEKVLFPKTMAVIKPVTGRQLKVNYYSSIYRDLDEYVILDGKKKYNEHNAVLYDGADLYFFIEPVTVKFSENEISLSPLSFVIVNTFEHSVETYDYSSDTGNLYENVEENVFIENDDYKINASLDLMYYNGTSKLFIKKLDILKHL